MELDVSGRWVTAAMRWDDANSPARIEGQGALMCQRFGAESNHIMTLVKDMKTRPESKSYYTLVIQTVTPNTRRRKYLQFILKTFNQQHAHNRQFESSVRSRLHQFIVSHIRHERLSRVDRDCVIPYVDHVTTLTTSWYCTLPLQLHIMSPRFTFRARCRHNFCQLRSRDDRVWRQ